MGKKAVVFLAWGDHFINEVNLCIQASKPIQQYDLLLITDDSTNIDLLENKLTKTIRASFSTNGLLRKTELIKFLPEGYDSFLFLDSDTVVLEEISLGFEKAEKFHIVAAPAPHYSLDYFWGFDKIMKKECVDCKGQLQYNTGIIFFKKSALAEQVFNRWMELGLAYQNEFDNDQPFFTLAMEELDVNPYTLSISYNYRGFGEAISGVVRVWHSHGKLPKNINKFKDPWPPRKAWPGKVTFSTSGRILRYINKFKGKIKQILSN